MTGSVSPVHVRIAKLFDEVLTDRRMPLNSVEVSLSTLNRVRGGRVDYMLSSLVDVATALGYEVVIHLRERP